MSNFNAEEIREEIKSLEPRIKKVLAISDKLCKEQNLKDLVFTYREYSTESKHLDVWSLFSNRYDHKLGLIFIGNDLFLGNATGGKFTCDDFYTNGDIISSEDCDWFFQFPESFKVWEERFYEWLSKESSMDKKPSVPTTTEVIAEKIKKNLTVGSGHTVGNVLDALYKKYDKNLVNQAMCDFLRDEYLV